MPAFSGRQGHLKVVRPLALCIALFLLLAVCGWAIQEHPSTLSEYVIETIRDKSKSKMDRFRALRVLEGMDPPVTGAVAVLVGVLKDKDEDRMFRFAVAGTLPMMHPRSTDAIPPLFEILKDKTLEREIRNNAADAMGRILFMMSAEARASGRKKEASPFIPILTEMLKDKNEDKSVRRHIGRLLQTGAKGGEKAFIPNLVGILKDENQDNEARMNAALVLGAMKEDEEAIGLPTSIEELILETLIPVITEKQEEQPTRHDALNVVSLMGLKAKGAIPLLIKILKDNNENKEIKKEAIRALGNMGLESRAAIPVLTELLKDKGGRWGSVRSQAAQTLAELAETLQEVRNTDSIPDLRKALSALKEYESGYSHRRVTLAIQALEDTKRLETLNLLKPVYQNKWIRGIIIYLFPVFSFSVLLLWLRPLLILRMNGALTNIEIKSPLDLFGVMKIPIRYILLIGFFHYHRRVLDAWVAKHIESFRKAFQNRATVRDRSVHIGVPVILEGKVLSSLSVVDLRPFFSKQRERTALLICGEGGVGKTSLACQIAKWAMSENNSTRLCEKNLMIPVLIEYDLDIEGAEAGNIFEKAIRGQLEAMIGIKYPLPDTLLYRLLTERRVMVIVDRFSELSENTRKLIRPSRPDFPVKALVITSRIEEALDGIPRVTVKPLRIQGNRLSTFMEAYLVQREKRDLFEDPEFFDACRKLSVIVGQRDITALLAKLYAEQIISHKENAKALVVNNIPDLMLNYLNELNRGAAHNEPDNRTVHRAAKALAWECIKGTYRPTTTKRDNALAALNELNDPVVVLDYLEKGLGLIKTIGAAQDEIVFTLEPLVEYLSALHLIHYFGDNELSWQDFLKQADKMEGAPETIQSFLLTVRDCCVAEETNIPNFISCELEKRLYPSQIKD